MSDYSTSNLSADTVKESMIKAYHRDLENYANRAKLLKAVNKEKSDFYKNQAEQIMKKIESLRKD